MRIVGIVAPVVVVVTLALSPSESAAQASVSAQQRAAITDSVRRVTDSVFDAGRRRDLDRMFALYSPTATLLHDGKPENWAEHQAGARGFYKTLRAVDFRPLTHDIDILSPTAAVWRGQYAYSFTDTAGRVTSGTAATTWVLSRTPSGWRIVHIHISDPLPAPK